MKKIKFMVCMLVAMAAIPILQSCLDDDQTQSDSLVISTINMISPDNKEFYFTLDNGKTMFPNNSNSWMGDDSKDGQRAFVIFNELDEPVNGYDYHIQIRDIKKILTKEIVTLGEGDNTEEKIGDDKINATYMWITQDKKYLTIEFQYYGSQNENKKHFLNLVINNQNNPSAAEASSDYIDLEFRHNAENDAPYYLDEGYVSFKLEQIKDQLAGKKGLRIRVNTLYNGEKFYEVNFPSSN